MTKQEENRIRFENMENHGGWYSKYEYKTVGMILHYIYKYSCLRVAERVIVGADTVYYPTSEKVFATYHWDDDRKLPVFVFNKDNEDAYNSYIENQEVWLEGIKNLQDNKEWLPDMNATVLG